MKKQNYTFYFNTFKTKGVASKTIRAINPEEAYEMLTLTEKLAVSFVTDEEDNEFEM
jgi:hypothetical protein